MRDKVSEFYYDILEFNQICGTFQTDDKRTKLQLYVDLVKEESKELIDAMHEGDLTEVLDGAIDTLVTAFGTLQVLHQLYGIDVMDAALETTQNNLSKCPLLAELGVQEYEDLVKYTIEMYATKGITAVPTEDSFGERLVFKNAETGKVLKPFGYVPNDLSKYTEGKTV